MKKFNRLSFLIPIIIILLVIIIVIISPDEKEIASGIKPVYVHVSLTWAAMILFLISSLIALLNIIKNSEKIDTWLQNIFGVAIAFHFAGLIMSLVSSYVNWGGIPIGEARYQTTIYVLIFGGISFLVMRLIKLIRLKSLFGLIPSAILIWNRVSSQIGLHPEDPVMNAPAAIKYTFLSLFVLMLALSVWLIAYRNTLSINKLAKND